MALIVPDEVLHRAGLTENELLLEIAILLFQQDKLTLAQASKLAGISRIELQRALASRGIPLHYDVADFQSDLKTLHEVGLL
jgi:predicted HTH domain antitoxin